MRGEFVASEDALEDARIFCVTSVKSMKREGREREGDRGGLFYEDVATKRGTMEEFVMEILGREKKLLRSL